MSWTKKVKHPSKLLEIGQEVECQVLEVDARAKRISLGLKQLEPDPWTLFTDKYNPGDKIARQGPLAHRLRRVRRHRRGRRRHGPQDRPLVDGQRQQPGRPLPQGRRRRGHHPLDQPRREEGLASASSSSATIRGRRMLTEYPPGRVIDDAQVLTHGRLRRVRAAARRRRGPHLARSDVLEPEGGKIKLGDKVKVRGLERSTPSTGASS